MMRKWSDLGVDLVMMIEESVELYMDKVRFRAVCKSWNSFPPKIPNLKSKQLPWLFHEMETEASRISILPWYSSYPSLDNNREASHGLFNPIDKKVYLLNLADNKKKLFTRSYNGWVLTEEDINIYLMNPLTRSRIELPPQNTFPNTKNDEVNEQRQRVVIHKVVWSSSPPLENNCVVFVICGDSHRLAYCKPNEDKWKSVCDVDGILDIIFHKGKLHALTSEGDFLVFGNIDQNSEFTRNESNIPICKSLPFNSYHLVESSDGWLLTVEEEMCADYDCGPCPPETSGFRVYKHELNSLKGFRLENIGDEIIFLGQDSSPVSVSCIDFPGFKGNRIYFTEKLGFYCSGSDVQVFNLGDGSFEPVSGFIIDPFLVWPLSVWVTPSLC